MPELAEVEFYRKQWNPGIGRTISGVFTHPAARIFRESPAASFEPGLLGRRFLASYTHGKQMMFEFSGGAWLGLHLGMSGELFAAEPVHEIRKRDHLVLVFDELQLVFSDYRMFGKVTLEVTGADAPDWWRNLPPEITGNSFTQKRVADFIRRFPKTPVKTLLLDQRGFPGIGNWMADEICWQLHIAPQTRAGSLDDTQIAAIRNKARSVSREALRVIATDWGDLPDSWLMNHRWRDGGLCPRRGCRSELLREDLRGRTTCWCPACQK
jgi:formamidopyrimidine-DNA glycosylase